jgi:hypothetical protein
MSGQPQERWWQWVQNLVQRFREKGATSPEKAMTAQELGLHERFEQAMKRRLGQTGIFVDAGGGKYYLNEDALRSFEERRQSGEGYRGLGGSRRNAFGLRIVRMLLGLSIVLLVVVNFFDGRRLDIWYLIIALALAWICVTVLQIFFMARRYRF